MQRIKHSATGVVFVLFVLGSLVFRPDLYPFSTYPMFSDATESISWLEVQGPDGPVSAKLFDLESDYVYNPEPRYGRRSVVGPNPLGALADPADIEERVARRIDESGLAWIEVTQHRRELGPDGKVAYQVIGTWRFEP